MPDRLEWHAQAGGGIELGGLRSEGWIARHVAPGEIRACRPFGLEPEPEHGWQRGSVGDEIRALGVDWPAHWPDHGAVDITDREADMLAATKTAHDNGFDGFLTGRTFRRGTAERLVDSGHLTRIRVVVCDGDGWAKEPERERSGYAITDKGRAALDEHVFPWERDDPQLRVAGSPR